MTGWKTAAAQTYGIGNFVYVAYFQYYSIGASVDELLGTIRRYAVIGIGQ